MSSARWLRNSARRSARVTALLLASADRDARGPTASRAAPPPRVSSGANAFRLFAICERLDHAMPAALEPRSSQGRKLGPAHLEAALAPELRWRHVARSHSPPPSNSDASTCA